MVIFEGTLAHKWLHHKMDATHIAEADGVVLGFGKAASFIMMGYVGIKIIGIAVDNNWHYLTTGWGLWFLVELIGFVLFPAILYSVGSREKNTKLIRIAAVWTVLGIMLNRLNVSLIAFNWHLPSADRYFPSFMEFFITLFIITIGVVAYKFVVTRMPILYEHPEYKEDH